MKKIRKKKRMSISIRIILCVVMVLGLLMAGSCAEEAKVCKVGILSGFPFFKDTVDGFKSKMAELGYKENENIIYFLEETEVDMAVYEKVVKKFVEDEVDLIFVFPTEATVVAKQVVQGTDIPIVFAQAMVEGSGLIDSIREPGNNITGVRFPAPEITLRRFELLDQVLPNMKRLFVPYLKDYPGVKFQSEKLFQAAEARGITIEEIPFSAPDEFAAFLDECGNQGDIRLDAILCYAEPLGSTPVFLEPLITFAGRFKIPVSDVYIKFGEHATLFDVMINNVEVGEEAAVLADKVLKGTDAGTIPVVTPENRITIDYQMAQKLGIEIPEGILQQADKVMR